MSQKAASICSESGNFLLLFTQSVVSSSVTAHHLHIERLESGAFLANATNMIAVGKPGVGKSHIAAAIGYELILAGHAVLWTPTANLVRRLLAARRDLRLHQE